MKKKLKKFYDIIPPAPKVVGFAPVLVRQKSRKARSGHPWSLAALMAISLVGLLSTVPMERTWSFYGDTEKSVGNILKAGSIDFSVNALRENEGLREALSSGTAFTQWATIGGDGTLGFQYNIGFQKINETNNFCDSLSLEASLEGITHYDGKLVDFVSPVFDYSDTMDEWKFVVNLSEDRKIRGVCDFHFVFSGWQEGATDFSNSAFADKENSTLVAIENLLDIEPATEFEPAPISLESFDALNLSVDLNVDVSPAENFPPEAKVGDSILDTAPVSDPVVSDEPIILDAVVESPVENLITPDAQPENNSGSIVEPEPVSVSEPTLSEPLAQPEALPVVESVPVLME